MFIISAWDTFKLGAIHISARGEEKLVALERPMGENGREAVVFLEK